MALTSTTCSQTVSAIPGLAAGADPTIVGRYRVEELLRSGASGVVAAARHVHLHAPVTLTILASYTDQQEAVVQGELQRARLAARLQGPHIARVVDIGETAEGMRYIATERLEGKTLEAELAERGRLPPEEAARWALEACVGLAEAHCIGIVHGDLKPQGILLAEVFAREPSSSVDAVDRRVLKILGFGTPSSLDALGDQSLSAFFGSPAFLAPEQLHEQGVVDGRTDVWALGALLYNMLSGGLPFDAESLSAVMLAVVQDVPALLTSAPCALAALVQRCLEKEPRNRPQDVMELARALAPFAGDRGARLAEHVRVMLEAPLQTQRLTRVPTAASSSGSIPALSVSLLPPSPFIPIDDMTQPSMHVVAGRRRSLGRARVFATLGAFFVLGLAAWATVRSSLAQTQGSDVGEAAPAAASVELTTEAPAALRWMTGARISSDASSPALFPSPGGAPSHPCQR